MAAWTEWAQAAWLGVASAPPGLVAAALVALVVFIFTGTVFALARRALWGALAAAAGLLVLRPELFWATADALLASAREAGERAGPPAGSELGRLLGLGAPASR